MGAPLVLDEQHQELCRLGVAGVSADLVDAVWALIKALSGMQSHFLAPFRFYVHAFVSKLEFVCLACSG